MVVHGRNHKTPLPATRQADKDVMLHDSVADGSYYLPSMDEKRILLICPCGCKGFMNLRVGEQKPNESPSWQLTGTLDAPTLRPSIRDMGGCRFHGHLTDGTWTFEGDSGVRS